MLSQSPLIFFPKIVTKDKPYKQLSDYKNIIPLAEFDLASGHARYKAQEKINNQPDQKTYEDQCYLLMREGKFRAEVEQAMSKIYQYFLGYGTDIEIIKDNDDYYVASRTVKDFKTWGECLFEKSIKMLEDGKFVYIEEDGSEKPVVGLGKLFVLTRFFADTDSHWGNFGLQKFGDVYRAFKIDNEKSFSFENQGEKGSDFENDLCDEFNKVTETNWYQQEKTFMLNKLARTDFAIIENILRKNITSNELESGKWLCQHLIKFAEGEEKEEFVKNLEKINKADPADYGVDKIVATLRSQHQKLQSELGYSSQFQFARRNSC